MSTDSGDDGESDNKHHEDRPEYAHELLVLVVSIYSQQAILIAVSILRLFPVCLFCIIETGRMHCVALHPIPITPLIILLLHSLYILYLTQPNLNLIYKSFI